ncbi:hypothetical protein N7457_000931 [Penicillium paradoxum]|uniref:uncharacterized protein n=1 Tax=Penicillium paradoxum TaxID=176176 RepID=UPI00254974B0|nr:uncharacterized protein N7457_000931 [Penicillium paradoxum]KAJ5794332.1 hypothetical protein N7457_000931 [Penicillium paradoxum]
MVELGGKLTGGYMTRLCREVGYAGQLRGLRGNPHSIGTVLQCRGRIQSEDSLVVTHPTTNSPACGLSTAERTGSPVFHTLWSYVPVVTRARNIFTNLNKFGGDGVISRSYKKNLHLK